jgi:hypothetical protein
MSLAYIMADRHPYADIFGKPNRGPHSYRLFGLAIVDLGLTVAAAAGAAAAWRPRRYSFAAAFVVVLLVFLIAGLVAHEAFGVRTRLNCAVFGHTWRP